MPFLLRETSSISTSARVDLAIPISFIGVSSWEWRFRVHVNGAEWILASPSITSASNIVFFTGSNKMQLRRDAGGNITFTLPNAYNSGAYDYVLSTTGNGIQLTQDGTDCPPSTNNTDESIWNIEFFFTFGNGNRHGDLYHFEVYKDGALTNNYNKQTLIGSNDTVFPDTAGGNDGTLVDFPTDDSQWVFFEDGGTVTPEPELHEFSGNAIVSALSFAQISKITQHNGQALITASATASSTKVINVSGGVTVVAQSVSLFEKLNTFNGAASVIAISQSSASKLVPFSGQATVSVTANASIIDGDLEIHSFSGGALITASASGQAMKVVIVSGSVNVTASISAQASKTALLSGNATVSTSTQSLLSKIANITGNAITRVTTLAEVLKRVTLSGASRVGATASGTFFNAESNVETYELTVQGRVKAPIVVQGRVKSLTIQGRVK